MANMRPTYEIDIDESLPYDLEYALSRVFEEELNYMNKIQHMRKKVTQCNDFTLLKAFELLDRSAKHFLTFNRSDDAERVQDVLTVLRWMQISGAEKMRLTGLGQAGVWSVFAAAACPLPVSVDRPSVAFDGSDEAFTKLFFVPGIQRAGGWSAAQSVVLMR